MKTSTNKYRLNAPNLKQFFIKYFSWIRKKKEPNKIQEKPKKVRRNKFGFPVLH
jgi:hypothetical protein